MAGCAAREIKQKIPVITEQQYKKFTWQEKATYFEGITEGKTQIPAKEIYNAALRETVPSVVIAAIGSISKGWLAEYRETLYTLLKYKNPVVRWKACKKITEIPIEGDLPYLVALFSDKDWMVRECAFSQVRLYLSEREEKVYFFTIIASLNERNIQVIKEIYQTLKWYNDERTFTFMYKRMFHVASPQELIVIMRELAEYKNAMVKQRIWYFAKHHPDSLVREEATRLLGTM